MDRRIPAHFSGYTLSQLSASTFPFYNLIENEDRKGYIVEVALAGYNRENLSVTALDNIVTVKGKQNDQSGVRYLHKGISSKDFVTSIQLPSNCTVSKASFFDGILSIILIKKEELNIPIEIDSDDVSSQKKFLTERTDIV